MRNMTSVQEKKGRFIKKVSRFWNVGIVKLSGIGFSKGKILVFIFGPTSWGERWGGWHCQNCFLGFSKQDLLYEAKIFSSFHLIPRQDLSTATEYWRVSNSLHSITILEEIWTNLRYFVTQDGRLNDARDLTRHNGQWIISDFGVMSYLGKGVSKKLNT